MRGQARDHPVEMKAGSNPVRRVQKEMHTALEAAGIKVLVVKESRRLGLYPPAAPRRGRPIKSNDSAHQQARERARRYRARKVIAQTGKVTS